MYSAINRDGSYIFMFIVELIKDKGHNLILEGLLRDYSWRTSCGSKKSITALKQTLIVSAVKKLR